VYQRRKLQLFASDEKLQMMQIFVERSLLRRDKNKSKIIFLEVSGVLEIGFSLKPRQAALCTYIAQCWHLFPDKRSALLGWDANKSILFC